MIHQDSIEKRVAELDRQTLALKTAQPFFNGQLSDIKVYESSYITAYNPDTSVSYRMIYATFTGVESGFCEISVNFYDSSGTMSDGLADGMASKWTTGNSTTVNAMFQNTPGGAYGNKYTSAKIFVKSTVSGSITWSVENRQ